MYKPPIFFYTVNQYIYFIFDFIKTIKSGGINQYYFSGKINLR